MKLSLTVDAEGLCDYARDFMLSERPNKALRFVIESLLQDAAGSLALARAILDGTSRLQNAGNSTFIIVEETEERRLAYRKHLEYIYAGRVQLGSSSAWWRPVAEVEGTGGVAARQAAARAFDPAVYAGEPPIRALHDWHRRIAEYHAYQTERVVRVGQGLDTEYLIFEPCGELPCWWSSQGLDAAVASARQVGRLSSRPIPDHFHVSKMRPLTWHYEKELREQTANSDDIEDIEDGAQAAREIEYAMEDAAFEERCAAYGAQVREQAAGDTFELVVGDKVYVVPRAPFEHWALRRTGTTEGAPPWTPVCPSGLKLGLDDPYHSDWMVGAGISLKDAYERNNLAMRQASYAAMDLVQRKRLGYEVAVVLNRGPRRGVVGEDIAVIPHLGPEYVDALRKTAILTEAGGAMAHLAVAGLEKNVTIMRVTDAVERFPEGTKLYLDPDKGQVKELE